MTMRILVTDGMDAGALKQLCSDGFEVAEQFYEPDALGQAPNRTLASHIGAGTKEAQKRIGGELVEIIRELAHS